MGFMFFDLHVSLKKTLRVCVCVCGGGGGGVDINSSNLSCYVFFLLGEERIKLLLPEVPF